MFTLLGDEAIPALLDVVVARLAAAAAAERGRPRSQVQREGTQGRPGGPRVPALRGERRRPAGTVHREIRLLRKCRVPRAVEQVRPALQRQPRGEGSFLDEIPLPLVALHLGSPQQIQPRRIQGMAGRGQGQVGRLPVAAARGLSRVSCIFTKPRPGGRA